MGNTQTVNELFSKSGVSIPAPANYSGVRFDQTSTDFNFGKKLSVVLEWASKNDQDTISIDEIMSVTNLSRIDASRLALNSKPSLFDLIGRGKFQINTERVNQKYPGLFKPKKEVVKTSKKYMTRDIRSRLELKVIRHMIDNKSRVVSFFEILDILKEDKLRIKNFVKNCKFLDHVSYGKYELNVSEAKRLHPDLDYTVMNNIESNIPDQDQPVAPSVEIVTAKDIEPIPEPVQQIVKNMSAVPAQCPSDMEQKISLFFDNMKAFMLEKHRRYGSSAFRPLRVFSKLDANSQLLVRMDDKISRIQNSPEPRMNDFIDLLGYDSLYCISQGWTDPQALLD